MENINFSLNELEINKQVGVDIDDMNLFLGYDDIYDIEQMKLYYSCSYSFRSTVIAKVVVFYMIYQRELVDED